MTNPRVILITASGPGGNQVDVGVRSDATPAELVMSIGNVLGVGLAGTIAEHHAPPRPGVPRGTRARLDFDLPLADSGVVDGDMLIFASRAGGANRAGAPTPPVATYSPSPVAAPYPPGQATPPGPVAAYPPGAASPPGPVAAYPPGAAIPPALAIPPGAAIPPALAIPPGQATPPGAVGPPAAYPVAPGAAERAGAADWTGAGVTRPRPADLPAPPDAGVTRPRPRPAEQPPAPLSAVTRPRHVFRPEAAPGSGVTRPRHAIPEPTNRSGEWPDQGEGSDEPSDRG